MFRWWARSISCLAASISRDAWGGGEDEPRSLIGSSEKITQRTSGWLSTSRSNRLGALCPAPSASSLLPLMPWLSTPATRPESMIREASRLGQRRLALKLEPTPSVIEAPSVTTAPCEEAFCTSTFARK